MKRRIFIHIDRFGEGFIRMEKIDKVFLLLKNRIVEYFQGFGRFFKRVLLLFTQDYVETALFILFCTIITAATTSILKRLLVKAMMLVSGVTYIAPVNLTHVLLNPLSIIMMLIFAVVVTLLSLFEIAGLLHTFSVAQAGYETNLTCMFMAGFRACRKALNPRNWLLTVFILVLFPLRYDNEVLGVSLPDKVELQIVECEPAVKGDTATSATKNAKLETGLDIRVPLFIQNGEMVLISTADGKYSGRA